MFSEPLCTHTSGTKHVSFVFCFYPSQQPQSTEVSGVEPWDVTRVLGELEVLTVFHVHMDADGPGPRALH